MSHGEAHAYDDISLVHGVDMSKALLLRSIVIVFFAVRLE